MRRIAFINEKGGTCKTTLSVNIAAYLAERKCQKVLLIDLDTQGHAGKSLGIDVRTVRPTVFHWLTDPKLPFDAAVQKTSIENLSVVPAYKELSAFPIAVAADPRAVFRLADRLKSAEASRYDVVIFDAPPSMGLCSYNILVASDEVVIPVGLTYLALDGCAEMVETVRRVREEHRNTALRITRVVPTLYRKTQLAEEILGKLRAYFPGELSRAILGLSVKIDEAQSHGKTIWEYAPKSSGAKMLAEIAEEVFAADAGAVASVA